MKRDVNKLDFLNKQTIGLYILLVFIGWINIYSVGYTFNEDDNSFLLSMDNNYTKQLIWVGVCLIAIYIIRIVGYRFFINSPPLLYILGIVLLLGLLPLGSEVKGATSWYRIGSISFQPSELSKLSTALFFAFIMSRKDISISTIKGLFIAFIIVVIPSLLILIEPDVGSVLTFTSFLIVLSLMGNHLPVTLFIYTTSLFILGILYDHILVFLGILSFAIIVYVFLSLRKKMLKSFNFFLVWIMLGSVIFLGVLDIIWNNVLYDRHRDRINVVLGIIEDNRGIGYNTEQSKIAIGSGEFFGRGFTKGIYNKGSFVPEQHSDFIFCTIGEEYGFLGSIIFIILYTYFILNIFKISKRQNNRFAKIYGFSVTSFLFIHFFINISMTLGIMPVIGIPLPFISYGGSSLIVFTMMLFILIKLDIYRNEITL